jgi:hypothetical protein
MPLNEHVEWTVEQKFAKPADKRPRDLGNLPLGVSSLLPFAHVSGNRADRSFSRLGRGRKEQILASLARLSFELEMGEFVTL